MEHWVLGGAFMENFYVTFDATSPEQLKVGLSFNDKADLLVLTPLILTLSLIVVGVLLALFIVVGICCCCRNRRQARLAKAKTYFD